jgi:hypothetical protein
MMRFIRPRLRAPAQMALLGLAGTAAIVVGQGWENAITFAVLMALAVIGVYVWGGRDTDQGALIGSRADERQASLQMKVTAFQGKVLSVAAGVAFLVAIAVNARPLWPFVLCVAVSGVSGLAGWAIYRDDRHGQADGPDPEHFIAVQPPPSGMPLTQDSK